MASKGKFSQWNHLVGNRGADVTDLWDPSVALPSAPEVGDSYIATDTGNGWAKDTIYTWNGSIWVPTVPVVDMQVTVLNKSAEYIYRASGWEVISVATKAGRNAYLQNTPEERAAEWNGVDQNQHTVRRGRAAWAKSREPEPEESSSSSVSAAPASSVLSSSSSVMSSSSMISSSSSA